MAVEPAAVGIAEGWHPQKPVVIVSPSGADGPAPTGSPAAGHCGMPMLEAIEASLGGFTLVDLLLVFLAAAASGLFHTLNGFAGGVVLSLLLVPIIGVANLVPVLSVALAIGASSRLWAFRKLVDLRLLATVMLPAFPGIVIGAYVYSRLSADMISLALGLFLVILVPLRRPLEKRGFVAGHWGLGAVAVVFGLLSGVTVGAGMLLTPFLLGLGVRRERLAALFAATGFCMNVTRATTFGLTATLDPGLTLLGVFIGLSVIPGTYAGLFLLMRTPIRIHTVFVELISFTAGVVFIINGVRGLAGW